LSYSKKIRVIFVFLLVLEGDIDIFW
jgi:hypothetical protein